MATSDTSTKTLDAWRVERFVDLGFSFTQARQLAWYRNLEGRYPDIHEATRLLKAGATHSQIVRILQ